MVQESFESGAPWSETGCMDLRDAQWAILNPLLPPRGRPEGRGRPWRDARAVLNGVLWVLRTGAPWRDLPFGSIISNLSSSFSAVAAQSILSHVLTDSPRSSRPRQDRLSERFIDATSPAPKRAMLSGRFAEEKAVKSWRSWTAMVFLSPSASPALHRMKKGTDRYTCSNGFLPEIPAT